MCLRLTLFWYLLYDVFSNYCHFPLLSPCSIMHRFFLSSSYASCIPFSFCRFLLPSVTWLGLLCIHDCLRTSFSPLLGPGLQEGCPRPDHGSPPLHCPRRPSSPCGRGCSPPLRGPHSSHAALDGDEASNQRHALGCGNQLKRSCTTLVMVEASAVRAASFGSPFGFSFFFFYSYHFPHPAFFRCLLLHE